MINLDVISFFIFISGFVIGLGAVTVIDIHGFLGRNSTYWTEASIRTHKVTKPLIWLGIFLAVLGGIIFYRNASFFWIPAIHLFVAFLLILNGCFLSFKFSPFLLQREKEGKSAEILPLAWQRKVMVSLIVSDLGWWGSLFLLALYIFGR